MTEYDWHKAIDAYYPADRKVRGILLTHSRCVANMAKEIAIAKRLPLHPYDIEAASMLHDIGIIATNAPRIDCYGDVPYLCHGSVGADMLRRIGVPERYALVAERHTGAGLTAEEITAARLPLPEGRSYMPETLLEQLVCYADCFYSKGADTAKLTERKPLERVRSSMAYFGDSVLARFDELDAKFAIG